MHNTRVGKKEVILRKTYVHVEKEGARTGQGTVAHKVKDIFLNSGWTVGFGNCGISYEIKNKLLPHIPKSLIQLKRNLGSGRPSLVGWLIDTCGSWNGSSPVLVKLFSYDLS